MSGWVGWLVGRFVLVPIGRRGSQDEPKDKFWHLGWFVFFQRHHGATRRLQEKAGPAENSWRKTLQKKAKQGGKQHRREQKQNEFWAPLRRPPSLGASSHGARSRTGGTQKFFSSDVHGRFFSRVEMRVFFEVGPLKGGAGERDEPPPRRLGGGEEGANRRHTERWCEIIFMSFPSFKKRNGRATQRRQRKIAPPEEGGDRSERDKGTTAQQREEREKFPLLLGGAVFPPLSCWVALLPLFLLLGNGPFPPRFFGRRCVLLHPFWWSGFPFFCVVLVPRQKKQHHQPKGLGGERTRRRGTQDHPKKEEAKVHHPTDERRKAAHPKEVKEGSTKKKGKGKSNTTQKEEAKHRREEKPAPHRRGVKAKQTFKRRCAQSAHLSQAPR